MARILIIDDDELIRASLSRCFEDMGHDIALAGGLAEGLALAATGVDVIYLDLNLPDGEGQKAMSELAASRGEPEIIVITGLGDNYGARQTLEGGAWDYIRKPASPQSVKASLAGALKYREERRRGRTNLSNLDQSGIIGDSPAMRRAKELLLKAAESEAGALITGETGVGKELAARAIHASGRRKSGPFAVVDCSNLSETLVESALYGHVKGAFTGAYADRNGLVTEADGGTLFLDEVGELPLSLQKSFLRLLQERRYRPVGATRELSSDFRLVAATNRDLDAMARAGEFRSDLLFRLRTLEINLPPLRERGEDLPKLARHFIGLSSRRYNLPEKRPAPQLLAALSSYSWPGNVRELSNVMEAAVIEAGADDVLYPKHLPAAVRLAVLGEDESPAPGAAADRDARAKNAPPPYAQYKARRDKEYFLDLMKACDDDVLRASRVSGLSVPSIYRHLGLAGIPTRTKK